MFYVKVMWANDCINGSATSMLLSIEMRLLAIALSLAEQRLVMIRNSY